LACKHRARYFVSKFAYLNLTVSDSGFKARLGVHSGAVHDPAVVERKPRAVPGTLNGVVGQFALGERSTQMVQAPIGTSVSIAWSG
jgi:hypothetical protein